MNKSNDEILESLKSILAKENAGILKFSDKCYPELLKYIQHPPQVIFYKGEKIKKIKNCIAVVGTRKNTVYGRDAAIYFSRQLSKTGITVVSGIASGIDYWVHDSALKEKGGTIGVLGCGIDIVYPASNKNLFEKILINGSIITEFLPGIQPLKQNFPARNRIISGMSMGVVVIEAPEKSGALITADFALAQNREVFAVPGNIFSTESNGCHNLIKNGAKPVTKIDDILEELGHFYKGKLPDLSEIHSKSNLGNLQETLFHNGRFKNKKLDLGKDSRIIYDIIGSNPLSLEKIATISKFDTAKILQIIAELEIKNVIMEKKFNLYIRI